MRALLTGLLFISLALIGCTKNVQVYDYEPSYPDRRHPKVENIAVERMTIKIGNELLGLYPGRGIKYPVYIYNYHRTVRLVEIQYIKPEAHQTRDGFHPVAGADKWVEIDNPFIEIPPNDIYKAWFTLIVPENEQPPPKWEYWLNIKDIDQEGSLHYDYNVRCLVEMR